MCWGWPGYLWPAAVSTVEETGHDNLSSELQRLQPAEILAPDDFSDPAIQGTGGAVKRLAAWQFDRDAAVRTLTRHFETRDLSGFGADELGPALGAAGALFEYARATQGTSIAHVRALSVERVSAYVRMDAATRRNLELSETLRGEPAPPCCRCWTPALPEWGRAGCVTRCITHYATGRSSRRGWTRWRRCAGKARITLIRKYARTAPGGGRGAHHRTRRAPECPAARSLGIARNPEVAPGSWRPPRSACQPASCSARDRPCTAADLADLLARAILPEPASVLREGGVINDGFDAELDELRGIQNNCGEFLIALESRERNRTGIANLKVEYNRVHGFYIEVTNANTEKVPDDYRAGKR